MSREAMQMALEALEKLAKVEHPSHKVTYKKPVNGHIVTIYPHKIAVDAITLLRQALAEPEPRNQCAETCERARLCAICARGLEEPKHDLICVCGAVWEGETMVHPPQKREWVGLTDQEVMVAAYQAGFDIHEDYENEDDPEAMHWWTPDGEAGDDSLLKLRDLIEAKLKEKNT